MTYVKSIFIWLVGLAVSIFSSYILMFKFEDTLHRLPTSELLEPPGSLLQMVLPSMIHFALYLYTFVLLLALSLALKKTLSLKSFIYHRAEDKLQKIIHIFGYFLMLIFIFNYGKVLITYHAKQRRHLFSSISKVSL